MFPGNPSHLNLQPVLIPPAGSFVPALLKTARRGTPRLSLCPDRLITTSSQPHLQAASRPAS